MTPFSFLVVSAAIVLQPVSEKPSPPAAGTPAASTPAPASPSPAAVKVMITVNSDDAPDLKEWGEKAKSICETWYPKIVQELSSDGFTPRDTVEIVFRKTMRVPAATGGGKISVNAEYVTGHKDDFGMMVHELTHVVQAYPRQKADLGWLVEGIADYVRFWKYEPQVRQRPIDKAKASYKNSYRISAAFLGWLAATHDKDIVTKLNARLRKGNADDSIFTDLLNKSVDDLWKEFIEAGAPESPSKLEQLKTPQPAATPSAPSTPADKKK